jgi:hypothetical protein
LANGQLRTAMGIRNNQYQLDDVLENDEGFFTSVDTEHNNDKEDKTKRGRGSQKKNTMMVLSQDSLRRKAQKISKSIKVQIC